MEERTVIIKQGGGFGAFLRGAVIGAAIALLFAPRSGRETREMLSERGTEVVDRAKYLAKDTRERAGTLISDARGRAETIVHDARNKMQENLKGMKEGVEEKTKDLKREVEIMEDVNNPDFPL